MDTQLNELNQEWLDALCSQAKSNGYLHSALEVIVELNSACQERRPLNPLYQTMLDQMLVAFGAAEVDVIGFVANCQPIKP